MLVLFYFCVISFLFYFYLFFFFLIVCGQLNDFLVNLQTRCLSCHGDGWGSDSAGNKERCFFCQSSTHGRGRQVRFIVHHRHLFPVGVQRYGGRYLPPYLLDYSRAPQLTFHLLDVFDDDDEDGFHITVDSLATIIPFI